METSSGTWRPGFGNQKTNPERQKRLYREVPRRNGSKNRFSLIPSGGKKNDGKFGEKNRFGEFFIPAFGFGSSQTLSVLLKIKSDDTP